MTAVADFWGETVLDGPYLSKEDSLDALDQREQAFPRLYGLMPVYFPGMKTVLDYGCGPGHDTILFALNGAHVYYADISAKARKITFDRLELHGLRGEAIAVSDDYQPVLPKVDHVHCAGVLHHTSKPQLVLRGLREALNPGAHIRLMCYDGERSEHTQSDVPVTHWWTPDEVSEMAASENLTTEVTGSYPCNALWRPECWATCYILRAA